MKQPLGWMPTAQEEGDLRRFAIDIGLTFARDTRVKRCGLRRACIHELGHSAMYLALGVPFRWDITVHLSAAGDYFGETTFAPIPISLDASIVMALGGPLAEAALCGPKSVFPGAVDDIAQIFDAHRNGEYPLTEIRRLVFVARESVEANKGFIVAAAPLLARTRAISSEQLLALAGGGASSTDGTT